MISKRKILKTSTKIIILILLLVVIATWYRPMGDSSLHVVAQAFGCLVTLDEVKTLASAHGYQILVPTYIPSDLELKAVLASGSLLETGGKYVDAEI